MNSPIKKQERSRKNRIPKKKKSGLTKKQNKTKRNEKKNKRNLPKK
jgi:hypothetical protein